MIELLVFKIFAGYQLKSYSGVFPLEKQRKKKGGGDYNYDLCLLIFA